MNAQTHYCLRILSVQKSVSFFDNWLHAKLYVMGHGHVPVWEAKFQVNPLHNTKVSKLPTAWWNQRNRCSKRIPACQKGGWKRHVAQCRSKNETCKHIKHIKKQLVTLKGWFMDIDGWSGIRLNSEDTLQDSSEGCLQRIASDHDDGAPSPAKFPCKAYWRWQGSTFARTFKCLSGWMTECAWLQVQSLYHL